MPLKFIVLVKSTQEISWLKLISRILPAIQILEMLQLFAKVLWHSHKVTAWPTIFAAGLKCFVICLW